MSQMDQKRPKLPWLPAATSTTEQRVQFVPFAGSVNVEWMRAAANEG